MELTPDETAVCTMALDALIKHNHGAIPTFIRQVAVKIATDIDGAPMAARLPGLLREIGPEAAARVKQQAARAAGSKLDQGRPPLSALEAARLAGVSGRAIRAACQAESLPAVKGKIRGEWAIRRQDLAPWIERRNDRRSEHGRPADGPGDRAA